MRGGEGGEETFSRSAGSPDFRVRVRPSEGGLPGSSASAVAGCFSAVLVGWRASRRCFVSGFRPGGPTGCQE